MPRIELFPFRYRDRLTGMWTRARVEPEARYFTPHLRSPLDAELRR